MSRRIVRDVETGRPKLRQRGYVYQKGRRKGDPWNPNERAYGRYRIDVPGEHEQKEVRVALGYCRDEMDAMLRLQEERAKAWVLDLTKVRECISPQPHSKIKQHGGLTRCLRVKSSTQKSGNR